MVTVQERRREAERSGRMIDLTEHVSASVLAATAAKLEAEQEERDEAEAQKNVEEAVKPYKQMLVRSMSTTVC
jgi:type III secretory pathway component EscR